MKGPEDFALAIEKALAVSTADETEILAFQSSTGLTRVANSEIHQNVAETNGAVSVRAVVGNRIGTATTNSPDEDAVSRAVEAAAANARFSPRVDDWPGLPKNPVIRRDQSFGATEACSPGKRAELVAETLTLAKNNKLTMAGALSTGGSRIFVGNNHSGVSWSLDSEINANMVMIASDSTGHASWVGRDLAKLDMVELGGIAVEKALAGRKPQDLAPGAYTVILEPAAVADMLAFLAYVGLGALAVQENRSFMGGNFGKRLVDPMLTLWDDANDPLTLGSPFDYEGVPRQKITFFDRGVAKAVVYDSRTAAREGKTSTGHALPAPNPHGPIPMNLFLAPGDTPADRMISETERGILVTRFHYTNVEEPMKAVLTGMTRDGTFLIEDGRITCGLKNLRFTQSILEALNSVAAVGRETRLEDAFIGTCRCPALKIDGFHITGISDT